MLTFLHSQIQCLWFAPAEYKHKSHLFAVDSREGRLDNSAMQRFPLLMDKCWHHEKISLTSLSLLHSMSYNITNNLSIYTKMTVDVL